MTIPAHLVSLLDRLSRAPAALLTRLVDDADELWEPFLRDGPAAAIAGGALMAVVSHSFDAPVEVVFAAIIDPTTYPHWLVGARDIRAVDDDWPRPGSAFHHRVGLVGPLKIADLSKVLEVDEPELLSLEVRARPLGRGRATFRLRRRPGGDTGCLVELDEVPLGLLTHLAPVLDPITERRNRRSLAQLEDLILHGESHRAPG